MMRVCKETGSMCVMRVCKQTGSMCVMRVCNICFEQAPEPGPG